MPLLVVAMGLAIAYLPLELAGALLLAAGIFLAIMSRPLWGLYLLILAIPFGSLKEIPVGVMSLGGAEFLAALTLAAWLAQVMAHRRPLSSAPLLPFLLLFLFAVSISLPSALSLQYSLKGLLVWLEFLGIYLFVANALSPKEVKGALAFILLAGTLEALLGAYQFLFAVGPEAFALLGRFMRAYGTFRQPNPFGGYLGLILPLALGVALAPWRRANLSSLLLRALAGLGLVAMGAALVMSWSRGAWLGALCSLAFVALVGLGSKSFSGPLVGAVAGMLTGVLGALWFVAGAFHLLAAVALGLLVALAVGLLVAQDLKHRWVVAISFSLLLLLALSLALGGERLLPSSLSERLVDFLPYLRVADVRSIPLSDENYAVVERLAHWQAAVAMFSDHPLLGVGIGNYVPAYPAYALPGWEDPLGHAHNYYLHVAAEGGLVGLAAYLVLWGAAFWQAFRLHLRAEGEWRGLTLGVLGVMVALSVHSLFDNLYVQGMNMHLAMILGLLAVLDKRFKEDPCNG